MTTFVALIQQGTVLDQKALAVGEDEAALQEQADQAAHSANDAQTGESLAWAAVVVPVES